MALAEAPDYEQLQVEKLALRLARIEAIIGTPRTTTTITTTTTTTTMNNESTAASIPTAVRGLWGQVMQTAERLGEAVVNKVGDNILLHQLEKELLSSKDIISGPTTSHHDNNHSHHSREAVVLSREGDLTSIIADLKAIQELQGFITGPFLQDAEVLRGELSGYEARYVEVERQARAVHRDLQDLLDVYDQVVSLLSVKSIDWDEALTRMEQQ